MRRLSHAQQIVSTISVGVSARPAPVAISAQNRMNPSRGGHRSERMNHTAISVPSRAALVLPSLSEFSPS